MNLKDKMEQIYENAPPDNIPWNIKHPPKQLVELVESGKVIPCSAVDLGCGSGNYAIWLAKKGFHVTGIDFSNKALELAHKQAEQENVHCTFLEADLTNADFKPNTKYDFAYDWEVLHHVFPEDRERYIQNVDKMLQKGGTYFSVCFSEQDPDFGGKGKYRTTPMDTKLYFSSENEIEQLFTTYFEIKELTTIEIAGKYGPHMAVVALATKKLTGKSSRSDLI
jgi:cyclopropane fatty-acyl-phospholipid synthase-like methyltransferase